MRKYLHINLDDRSIETEELHGEDVIRSGRYLIAKTLLAGGVARVDPLSPENPLIFSAGPFAGSSFSNANRIGKADTMDAAIEMVRDCPFLELGGTLEVAEVMEMK